MSKVDNFIPIWIGKWSMRFPTLVKLDVKKIWEELHLQILDYLMSFRYINKQKKNQDI